MLDLSDAHGWNQPQYYRTIQTADLDGNGKADLIARGRAGLHTYRWGQHGWTAVGPVLSNLSDASGFNQPQYYRTIQTADLDGNGKAELLARTGAGIAVYQWDGVSGGSDATFVQRLVALRPRVGEARVLRDDSHR